MEGPKFSMIGGDGPDSYYRNSNYQKQTLISAGSLLNELISNNLDTENPNFHPDKAFKIADFGCSSGPNTFLAVQNIVSAIQNKYESNPEFHVFFNDVVQNDFNTLFNNLPSSRQYFAAAVPGSFHGRLFPEATLHFAHCSSALHWLSRIPKEVTERGSLRWNKGRIHYSGARKEVKEAYAEQYKEDMEAFLRARAAELVDGGMIAIVVLGFPDGAPESSQSNIGIAYNILGSCLDDMVTMGRIKEENVDSFNLPFYITSPSELRGLIEANDLFSVERLAALEDRNTSSKGDDEESKLGKARANAAGLRATVGKLIEEQFGSGVVDEVFELFRQKLSSSPILSNHSGYSKEINYFVFLKLKSHSKC